MQFAAKLCDMRPMLEPAYQYVRFKFKIAFVALYQHQLKLYQNVIIYRFLNSIFTRFCRERTRCRSAPPSVAG